MVTFPLELPSQAHPTPSAPSTPPEKTVLLRRIARTAEIHPPEAVDAVARGFFEAFDLGERSGGHRYSGLGGQWGGVAGVVW